MSDIQSNPAHSGSAPRKDDDTTAAIKRQSTPAPTSEVPPQPKSKSAKRSSLLVKSSIKTAEKSVKNKNAILRKNGPNDGDPLQSDGNEADDTNSNSFTDLKVKGQIKEKGVRGQLKSAPQPPSRSMKKTASDNPRKGASSKKIDAGEKRTRVGSPGPSVSGETNLAGRRGQRVASPAPSTSRVMDKRGQRVGSPALSGSGKSKKPLVKGGHRVGSPVPSGSMGPKKLSDKPKTLVLKIGGTGAKRSGKAKADVSSVFDDDDIDDDDSDDEDFVEVPSKPKIAKKPSKTTTKQPPKTSKQQSGTSKQQSKTTSKQPSKTTSKPPTKTTSKMEKSNSKAKSPKCSPKTQLISPTKTVVSPGKKRPSKSSTVDERNDDDDDSDDEFEDVEELENPEAVVAAYEQKGLSTDNLGSSSTVSSLSSPGGVMGGGSGGSAAGVEITLAREDLKKDCKKKKASEFDWEKHFESLARRHKKDVREAIHNVHLLCLIARGFYLSSLASREEIRALTLSLVPSEFSQRKSSSFNLYQLSRVYNWFNRTFKLQIYEDSPFDQPPIDLSASLSSRSADSNAAFVLLFLTFLRTIGFDSRLVMSLHPSKIKPPSAAETKDSRATEKKQKASIDEKGKGAKDGKGCAKGGRGGNTEGGSGKSVSKGKSGKKKIPKSSTSIEVEEIFYDFEEDLTSDGEAEGSDDNSGNDFWVESFLVAENRWVALDVINRLFDSPSDQELRATSPLHYVIGFGPGPTLAKDLTCKYASNWMTTCRKLRTDQDWLRDVMEPYRQADYLEVEENMNIQRDLVKKPMPASITEFKNHPLYALRRHLLKFETIYPDDQKPLAMIKGEPVYPRSAVRELMSNFKWRQKARMVRLDEKPYKVVKARPKFIRLAPGEWKKEDETKDLDLFGEWQTDPYISPPAVDGKVPRNDYGNVELFQPSMLPHGTVYLEGMSGLNSIAGKLGIDCAPAMVGFDFHGGRAHPTIEGWVVCEEFVDTLESAWEEAQSAKAERQNEKKTKRALDNWKLLVRALFIREKLKMRYKNPADPKENSSTDKEKSAEGSSHRVDENEWMRAKNPRLGKEDEKANLLPFEKL